MREFRNDIEGIRAIGAILVMAYHIWSQRVSGGVDVFFVVSAFLMTDMLLRSREQTGRLEITKFYSKILARITPLTYVVISVTLIAIVFLVSPTFWRVQFNEAIMASIHLENFHLARTSANYLDRSGILSPFQQFWALSLQVQFYVTLPVVLTVALSAQRWLNRDKLQIYTVLVLGAASFGYAQIALAKDPAAAYFSIFTRYWEFSIGMMLAFLTRYRFGLSNSLKLVGSIFGLFVLLAWGLIDFGNFYYPGIVALGPVLAAAVLILSGMQGYNGPVQSILKHPYAVAIGSLSFSIYLWHWPIFVFSRILTGDQETSILVGLGIIALAIATAFASKKFIEEPLRNILRNGLYRPFFVTAAVCSILLASILLFRQEIVKIQNAAPSFYQTFNQRHFDGDALSLQSNATTLSARQFIAVGRDVSATASLKCDPFSSRDKSRPKLCSFGDVGADRVVVLTGGSRAAHWEPLFSEIGKRHNFELISATRSACTFGHLDGHSPACRAWNEAVVSEIVSIQPDYVIVSATRLVNKGATVTEHVPETFVAQWQKILSAGIPIIALRDTPIQVQHPNNCLWMNQETAHICGTPASEIFPKTISGIDFILENEAQISYLDMTPLFCTETICPVYFDGRLMYRDRSHLTKSYMIYISKIAEERFAKRLPEFFD
ncbi:acyltransferase family protein [Sulfitobacter sp. F26169L]|uniref:acyltransferase family protein n=1 Tax=Sulfitobacter sp. F26169L TaxID=2996015 RepID=UPI002260F612|nr:acyltransferase family protein [Sulfitobacter sp. F26169L]MCX7568339.1 acyltransferase family protein [Sulfitobacter sp. F26169L]